MNWKTLLLWLWNVWMTYCYLALFTFILSVVLAPLGKVLFGWDDSFITGIISGIIVGVAMWRGAKDSK